MRKYLRASEHREVKGLHIRAINIVVIVLASLMAMLLLQATHRTTAVCNEMMDATKQYIDCETAARAMKDASNYLTTQARLFTITQDARYAENYFEEIAVTRRRENAVQTLRGYLNGENEKAYQYLQQSLDSSNELMERECYAIRLVMEAVGLTPGTHMEALDGVTLTAADRQLSPQAKLARAQELMISDEYQGYVNRIEEDVRLCVAELGAGTQYTQAAGFERFERQLRRQQVLTILLLVLVVAVILLVVVLILWPIGSYISQIIEFGPLPMSGAYELRYLAKAYNVMYEQNRRNSEALRHEAEHDPLTGLYNRGAYEKRLAELADKPIALLWLDVDRFKGINDTFGHDMGDQVLKKVAHLLEKSFRSSDLACRVGGDEFAVIMTDMNSALRDVVEKKLARLRAALLDNTDDGLPEITMSVGIAFSDRLCGEENIYKAADKALYAVKERGRNGYAFFGDSPEE